MNKQKRIEELVKILREASEAYYTQDKEIMSNYEYDALFDELNSLENETGYILDNSPTQNVGFSSTSGLEKIKHEKPALSLDKTKDRNALLSWLNIREGCLSFKCDGLTIVGTYVNGSLICAATRGNGYYGERIDENAKYFKGLPQKIPFKGKLIVRGEALMTYEEFNRINSQISDIDAQYKNPRNLASATVRLLDSNESSTREIWFYAFELAYSSSDEYLEGQTRTFMRDFEWLEKLGFNVVKHKLVNEYNLLQEIDNFQSELPTNSFPSDGLVLFYNSVEYGNHLGSTSHHSRAGMALKWPDKTVETVLQRIEWSASRTGLLNPVAVFDAVELEGTTVSRASTHNVSVTKQLKLGVGSRITVYKANMIIPQISENVYPVNQVFIPRKCPVCGGLTEIHTNNDIETLYCMNPDCAAKHVGALTHFVSREAMNILGLSEATLEKFIDLGMIHSFADIYHLNKYQKQISTMDGFGDKSYNNLIKAIDKSRNVTFSKVLTSIGIPEIGKSTAKDISIALGKNPVETFLDYIKNKKDFEIINGIGSIVNNNIHNWMNDEHNYEIFNDLIKELNIEPDIKPVVDNNNFAFNKIFVITGSLNVYKNRDELKQIIENAGGKVASSISAHTNFLINNDIASESSKNKKAQALNIPIISEETFKAQFDG